MPLGCEMRRNQEQRGTSHILVTLPHLCLVQPVLFKLFFLNGEILPLKCTDTLPDTDTRKRKSSALSRRLFYLKAWAGLTGGSERWQELRFLVGHS